MGLTFTTADRSDRSGQLLRALLATTVLSAGMTMPAITFAQSSVAAIAIDIPAQPLGTALDAFSRTTSWQIGYSSAVVAGKRSQAVSGTMSPLEALQSLLVGSGLSVQQTGDTTVALVAGAAEVGAVADDGSIVLDAIDVNATLGSGMGVGMTPDAPYTAPASVSVVSAEDISRFRGSSVGDFLRGTPGVLTGASTEKGALDLNVRGMQGMDRVPIVIDGTRQSQTVYEGYAGVSSRTYIDPDLLAGVTIEKGPSAAADAVGATGGIARMRTISASDIIDEGENFGIRVIGGLQGNTVLPPAVATRGGIYQPFLKSYASSAVPGDWGYGNFDRPDLLDVGASFNGSVAIATGNEGFELLAAYAKRKQGNYFAGTEGDAGEVILMPSGGNIVASQGGLGPYRAGEEVLNSGFNNDSLLLKGKAIFGENHSLELSYMRFETQISEMPWPGLTSLSGGQYQTLASTTVTDTYRAAYEFDAGDDLVDLNVNLWATKSYITQEVMYLGKIPAVTPTMEFAYLFDSQRWGIDADNTSVFTGDLGELSVQYGASYTYEDLLQLTRYEGYPLTPDRSGNRSEASAFVATEWKPFDWLQVDGSLRYTTTNTVDDCISVNATTCYGERSNDALSPIVAVTLEPWQGVQFYGRYAEATRSASMFESTAGASFGTNGLGIDPEHARNTEFGINLLQHDVLQDGDTAGFKIAYFDNKIDDYITRRGGGTGEPIFVLTNLDYASFTGIEVSADYESDTFFASLGYTRYLDTEFCGDIDLNVYSCAAKSGDDAYASLHLPPRETVSLTAGVKLMDALTLGARATYMGERVVDQVLDSWTPHTLVDVFATYEFSEDVKLDLGIDNVGDVFYVNPLSILPKPGPGRTFRASLTAEF